MTTARAAALSTLVGNPRKQQLDRRHSKPIVDELERWREVQRRLSRRRFQVHALPDSAGQARAGTGLRHAAICWRRLSRPTASASISAPRPSRKANELHPDLYFVLGDVEDPATLGSIEGPFDYIVIADTIGMFEDIDATLAAGASSVRAVDADHHLLLFASVGAGAQDSPRRWACGAKQPTINYIATADIANLLDLADFELVGEDSRQSVPLRLSSGFGTLINRFIATLPFIRRLCLRNYLVARPCRLMRAEPATLGQHHHSLSQRARQYRALDRPRAAIKILRRHRDPVRRGSTSAPTAPTRRWERVRAAFPGPLRYKTMPPDRTWQGRRRSVGIRAPRAASC